MNQSRNSLILTLLLLLIIAPFIQSAIGYKIIIISNPAPVGTFSPGIIFGYILPEGEVNQQYEVTFSTNSSQQYRNYLRWSVEGNIPPGLSLSETNRRPSLTLSGTTFVEGTFIFKVSVHEERIDHAGYDTANFYSIIVKSRPHAGPETPPPTPIPTPPTPTITVPPPETLPPPSTPPEEPQPPQEEEEYPTVPAIPKSPPTPPPKWTCGCKKSFMITAPETKTFTGWDSIKTGNVTGHPIVVNDIIVAQDDDGGRLSLYYYSPEESPPFKVYYFKSDARREPFAKIKYSKYDRIAVGNVIEEPEGSGVIEEILTAVDQEGESGRIFIYRVGAIDSYTGLLSLKKEIDLDSLGLEFRKHDAFLVGNVLGDDASDEVILSKHNDNKIYVIDNIGNITHAVIHEFTIVPEEYELFGLEIDGEMGPPLGIRTVQFNEFRYTSHTNNEDDDHNGHDVIAVGNVLGDETEEIIWADNWLGGRVFVFSIKPDLEAGPGKWKIELSRFFDIEFTKYDAMCVGDILGDSNEEIIIFRDEDRVALIYDAYLHLIKIQYLSFSKYDGVITWHVEGSSKNLILVAEDHDNCIHVFHSNELGE